MTREEKGKIIADLAQGFKSSDALVVCDYKGLKNKEIEILRLKAKEKGVFIQVVKNTLAKIAMQQADINGLEVKDTNIFAWGNQLDVCKVVADFNKNNDKFIIKTAFIDNEVANEDKVIALSKMPSREELLAMLLQVWNAPITNFTIGLDALRAKKEESA